MSLPDDEMRKFNELDYPISYRCKVCGNSMMVSPANITATCDECGTKFLVEEILIEDSKPEDPIFLDEWQEYLIKLKEKEEDNKL